GNACSIPEFPQFSEYARVCSWGVHAGWRNARNARDAGFHQCVQSDPVLDAGSRDVAKGLAAGDVNVDRRTAERHEARRKAEFAPLSSQLFCYLRRWSN